METGRRSFHILLPESFKIFELDVFFHNQIVSFLLDIIIFYHILSNSLNR